MFFTLKRLGIGLIFIGVALLAVQFLFHFTMINLLLLAPLFLIIAGVSLYVYGMKRESRY